MKNLIFVLLFAASVFGYGLGPSDSGTDHSNCDNCLYDDGDEDFGDIFENGDVDKSNTDNDVDEASENTRDELANRHSSYLDKLRNPLGVLWNATKKVANDVYNATAETLEDIEEIVRTVLNEEAYNMFYSAIETFQGQLATADSKFFGHTVSRLSQTVMSVTLLILVIFLNYALSGTISLLSLFVFGCSVFLLYSLFGARFIFERLIDVFSYTFKFFFWAVSYPFLFALSIVLLFIANYLFRSYLRRLICPVWCRSNTDVLLDMEARIDDVYTAVNDLDTRLTSMEKVLKEIHKHVLTIKKSAEPARRDE